MADRLDPFGDDTLGELPAPAPDADSQVEAALYRRAVGGTTWAEKMDRFGEVRRLVSDMPPDITAARIWLERRNPERWADKRAPDVRVIIARLGAGSEREAVTIDQSMPVLVSRDETGEA